MLTIDLMPTDDVQLGVAQQDSTEVAPHIWPPIPRCEWAIVGWPSGMHLLQIRPFIANHNKAGICAFVEQVDTIHVQGTQE